MIGKIREGFLSLKLDGKLLLTVDRQLKELVSKPSKPCMYEVCNKPIG